MTEPGQIKSINGYTLGEGAFADVVGYYIEGSDDPTANTEFLPRVGLPPEFSQSTIDEHVLAVKFEVPTYSDRVAVLGALNYPNSDDTVELEAYAGDPDSPTLCTADVAVQQVQIAPNAVFATLAKRDPVWRAAEVTDLGRTLSFTDSIAATIINNGHVRTQPYFKFGWSVQRSTDSTTIGWKYRRQITITNATDLDWEDELITIDAGNTASWVSASKAQADGDDVRVWYEGQEVYRTLTNFNTRKTFIHFLVSIPANSSATYDIVYGNTSVTAPRTMSTKGATRNTYAAPDLEGYAGTATSGSTSTMVDSGASWETDRWKGGWVGFLSGTGSVRWRRIASNTSTTLTLNRVVTTAPASGTEYVIFMSGILYDGGRVTGGVTSTAIQDNLHTRKWGTNSLKGATITFTGSSSADPLTNTIASNTSDTLTFENAWITNPSVNDQFTIQKQGKWSYVVNEALYDTVHRGIYRANYYYGAPTRTWPNGNTPAGWQIETRLPNDDAYGVYPAYNKGSGGGHNNNYWPIMRVYRRMKQVGSFSGQGVGDGYSIFTAFGFQGWYFDYYWRNINGIGKAMFASMDIGGQDWHDLVTNSSTVATLTAVSAQHVDLSSENYPTRLYMGVLPADEVAASGGSGDQIDLRNNTVLELWLNTSSFGDLTDSTYQIGSETECYEVAAAIRIGGGRDAERTPPFEEITLGGSGHRVMLPSGYELWVATNPAPGVPLFGVYDSTYNLDYVATWAGKIRRYIKSATDGSAVSTQSREFMPIPPAVNLITNGYFTTSIDGWETPVLSSGVTGTASWVATPDAGDGAGSMKVDITGTPAGAWSITIAWPQLTVIPDQNYPVGFAYRTTDNSASLDVSLSVEWQGGTGNDPTMTLGGAPAANDTWYYDADDEVTFNVPPGLYSAYDPTVVADVSIVISGSGSTTSIVYIDQVTFGVPNIHVTQTEGGTGTLKVSWLEGYLS